MPMYVSRRRSRLGLPGMGSHIINGFADNSGCRTLCPASCIILDLILTKMSEDFHTASCFLCVHVNTYLKYYGTFVYMYHEMLSVAGQLMSMYQLHILYRVIFHSQLLLQKVFFLAG